MQAVGVRGAITCACAVVDLEAHVAAAKQYPGVLWAALSIHPNEAPLHAAVVEKSPDGMTHYQRDWHKKYDLMAALDEVAKIASANIDVVVAIGETGIDYFRTGESGKQIQQAAFRTHIALAKQIGLALQIHDREAHADCIAILLEEGAPENTIFHCFSGDVDMAKVCADQGWYCSFAGPITYGANTEIRQAIQVLPAELVLAETDAPYLTPIPWRGHPNAPYVMPWTVRMQAALRFDGERAQEAAKTGPMVLMNYLDNLDTDLLVAWGKQLTCNTQNAYNLVF